MTLFLLFVALLLGILEGLTEFLPVSSTGHLIVASHLSGISLSENGVFEVAIQSGAICATLTLYRNRVKEALTFGSGYLTRNKCAFLAAAAFVPAALVGLFGYDIIKGVLFNPLIVAYALIIGGVVLIGAERFIKRRTPTVTAIEDISFKQALIIGCCQSIAVIPGSSRSACTIIGGMFCGLNRTSAAEFSFLLALPTMFAATAYDLYKNRETLNPEALMAIGIGFVAAYVTALTAMSFLLRYVKKYDFLPFAYYRIALGAVLLIILA